MIATKIFCAVACLFAAARDGRGLDLCGLVEG